MTFGGILLYQLFFLFGSIEVIYLPSLITPTLLISVAPLPLIFLRIAPFFAGAEVILGKGVKIFPVKETTLIINGPANVHKKIPRDPPYCTVLFNFTLRNFIFVDILLAEQHFQFVFLSCY